MDGGRAYLYAYSRRSKSGQPSAQRSTPLAPFPLSSPPTSAPTDEDDDEAGGGGVGAGIRAVGAGQATLGHHHTAGWVESGGRNVRACKATFA